MVNLDLLKKLREETGVSFSVCKKALEEAGDNYEAAKKQLSKIAGDKAAGKADRATEQGGVFVYVHHNRKVAGVVNLYAETDFVSGNEEFKKIGSEIAMQIATMPAENEAELIAQPYIRDAGKTIGDLLKDAILKFGENIKIGRFERWTL